LLPHGLAYGRADMLIVRAPALRVLLAVALLAGACSDDAFAQNCKPGSTAVPGTLAAPEPCPRPAAKPKPAQKNVQPQPDGFWSGVRIGGSVSATTTFRGR
jgi:hypothetical protein